MRKLRRIALGGFAVVATALVLTGLAWACTPHAMMADLAPGEGPVGTMVTVSGNHFEEREIEIRLNSSTGRLLARVPGPEFNYALKIPMNLEPGWIYVVALSRSSADSTQISGQAVKSFLVTAPSTAGTSTPGPAPSPGETAPPAAESTAAPAPSAAPLPATPAAPGTATTADRTAPSGSTGAADRGTAATPTATAVVSGVGRAAPTDRLAAAPVTPGVDTPAAVPVPEPAGVPVPVAAPVEPARADRPVSSRTATGDAWSSFAGRQAGPGLATDPAGAGDARGAAPAGLVVLALGMTALLATGAGALAHQRRLRKA